MSSQIHICALKFWLQILVSGALFVICLRNFWEGLFKNYKMLKAIGSLDKMHIDSVLSAQKSNFVLSILYL